MTRLWRSVVVLGLCFAAVIAMRIYLNKQIELAKGSAEQTGAASEVLVR